MKEVSTQLISQEVKFIPARVENHRHFQKTYACANCENSGTRTPFAKSEIPRLPLNNTAASASLIAETMYQKFEQKVPAYLQEAYWNLLGYPIPRHTIMNWHINTSQYYFEALVAEMRQELLKQRFYTPTKQHSKYSTIKTDKSSICGCSVPENTAIVPYISTSLVRHAADPSPKIS